APYVVRTEEISHEGVAVRLPGTDEPPPALERAVAYERLPSWSRRLVHLPAVRQRIPDEPDAHAPVVVAGRVAGHKTLTQHFAGGRIVARVTAASVPAFVDDAALVGPPAVPDGAPSPPPGAVVAGCPPLRH